jgi:hypothetical protein
MSLTASEIDVTVGIGAATVTPANSPATNTSNLQTILQLLVSPGGPTNGSGGTLIFPSVGDSTNPSYRFAGTIPIGTDTGGFTRPYSIIIKGDGQQEAGRPLLVQTLNTDLFVINTNDGTDDDDVGGVTFQDLMISYMPETPTAGNSAIRVTKKSQATRLLRVTLVDWPVGVNFNDSSRCSMIDCRVLTDASTIATTGVQLGDATTTKAAIETYIAGCAFYDMTSKGTAMQIYGCDHLRVMNCRMEQWLTGIAITPQVGSENSQFMYFENVSCYPFTKTAGAGGPALLMTTSGSSTDQKFILHATFVGCELSAPDDSPPTGYSGGGVVIGQATGTGPNDVIDQIRFVDCHVCNWQGPGLQIIGGSVTNLYPTNIEVLGGYYSLNGAGPAAGLAAAGIYIVGGSKGPSGIRITGAACNNSLFSYRLKTFISPIQEYGIFVNGAAENIRVNACDLTGNTANGVAVNATTSSIPENLFVRDCDFTGLSTPVSVTGPVSNLQILDCPGYNDKGTLITNTVPTAGTPFTIAQLGTAPYYGPGECYVNGGAITIDTHATGLSQGSFYLQPLETIEVASGTSSFLAIGK